MVIDGGSHRVALQRAGRSIGRRHQPVLSQGIPASGATELFPSPSGRYRMSLNNKASGVTTQTTTSKSANQDSRKMTSTSPSRRWKSLATRSAGSRIATAPLWPSRRA